MELLLLRKVSKPQSLLGLRYAGQEMTQDLLEEAVLPALDMYQRHQTKGWTNRWVEQEVFLNVRGAEGLCHGTADIIHKYPDHFDVSDWKFGRIAVKASSDQLMFYAGGAVETLPELADLPLDFPVRTQIYQPLLSDTPDVYETTVEALAVWKASYAAAVDEAGRINPELRLGDHCRYCPGRAICPALRGDVFSLAADRPDLLDPATLAQMADHVAPANGFVSATQQELKAALSKGTTVPGWKLIPGRKQRAWQDEEIALAVLTNFLPRDTVAPMKVISPARAELELRAAGYEPAAILASLIDESRQAPRAVPEDDATPALNTSALVAGLQGVLSHLNKR
jgi:hypothetical protein